MTSIDMNTVSWSCSGVYLFAVSSTVSYVNFELVNID